MKPHITDSLCTWLSLSHQANMLFFLLLVLQFGILPRVAIKEKKPRKPKPRNETRKGWRSSKRHFTSPMPCKGTKGTQEHLPWDPANLLLPLSRELQLRQKNADKVMNVPFS